jgi:hypothetical protein
MADSSYLVTTEAVHAEFGNLLVFLASTGEQVDKICTFLLEHQPYSTPRLGIAPPTAVLIDDLVANLGRLKQVLVKLVANLRDVPFQRAGQPDLGHAPIRFTSHGFMDALLQRRGLATHMADPFPGTLEEARLHETWDENWKKTALNDDYRYQSIVSWLEQRRAILHLSLQEKVITVANVSDRRTMSERQFREMARGIYLAQQDIALLGDAANLFRTTIPLIVPTPFDTELTKKRPRVEDVLAENLERASKMPRRLGQAAATEQPRPQPVPEPKD